MPVVTFYDATSVPVCTRKWVSVMMPVMMTNGYASYIFGNHVHAAIHTDGDTSPKN